MKEEVNNDVLSADQMVEKLQKENESLKKALAVANSDRNLSVVSTRLEYLFRILNLKDGEVHSLFPKEMKSIKYMAAEEIGNLLYPTQKQEEIKK